MSVTAVARPEDQSFRIGMLLSDSRYRSYTIQVIALFLLMLLFAWLTSNVIRNLAALGKDFNFGFLWDPASYDINQHLIPYTSRSTHARAALVGILNTLLVAFLGCFAATVIGVIAGVLRLSKNWIVSRLMTVYIEGIRNVPVLLQILLWYAIFIEILPAPNQFRETVPVDERASLWFDAIAATNRGFYIPLPSFSVGYLIVFAVIVLAIVAASAFGRFAKAKQEATGQQLPTFWVKAAIFAVPVLLMAFTVSWQFPELKGFNFQGGIHARNSLVALWFALSVYTGAFIAETVRAGILSVSHGQTEAAFALGLRPNRTMNLIILPQALRVIIPPLISQFLNLTKNSSLAIAVGYMDVTGTLGGITLNQTGRAMECMLLLMGFYLAISLSISGVMNVYNKRVKLVER